MYIYINIYAYIYIHIKAVVAWPFPARSLLVLSLSPRIDFGTVTLKA